MTTARDLIQGAFEAIRVYAPGEQALPADAARGFSLLNQMFDSWSTESLTCFAAQEQSVVLTQNKVQYTIGTSGGADINLARPLKLQTGPGAAYVVDTNGNRYPIDVIDQNEWNRIWNLTNTNSSWPTTLFYDPQFPLGKLNFYPQPNQQSMTAFWDSWLPLTDFASLVTAVSLPPGYERTIQTSLALELEPYYPTAVITPQLRENARLAKRNIKRINMREQLLVLDPALSSNAGAYNVYADSTARR